MAQLPQVLSIVVLLAATSSGQQITVVTSSGQQTTETTISEPAIVDIATLFKQADVVAVVRVVSGDSENYDVTVYRSIVSSAFKGAAVNQRVFFGPFTGLDIGGEYIAFLRRAKTSPNAKTVEGPTISYGPLDAFHLIMYQGYSIMPVRYVCAFDGRVPDQSCDYGVRINLNQVKLPSSIHVFPRTSRDDFDDGIKWVRRDVFMRILDHLKP